MAADAFDVIVELRTEIFFKLVAQIVMCASKHEVLPNDEAQLVTYIVKCIARVMAAAPYAHAIVVCRHSLLKELSRTLRARARQNVVLRDIVRTHREERHAVHFMRKALAVPVFLNMHRHRAQTDALFPRINGLAVTLQIDTHRVKRLLAEAMRPPKLRVFHRDLLRGACVDLLLAVRRRERHSVGQLRAVYSLDLRLNAERYSVLAVRLLHVCADDAAAVHAAKHNVAPNAGIRQAGTPVPAEHAMRLAQVREADHCVVAAARVADLILLFDVLCRRVKHDLKRVAGRFQAIFYVKFPRAVHVAHARDFLAVQNDVGNGVEALAAQ